MSSRMRMIFLLLVVSLLLAVTACKNSGNNNEEPVVQDNPSWTFTDKFIDIPSIRDVYKDDFEIGFGMDYDELDLYDNLLTKHAGGLTPGNSMKPDFIQPSRGNFTFDRADRLVKYAEERGMSVHGHTLVWHSQTPGWFAKGAGQPLSREEALNNMRDHIFEVVGHYKGVVKEWDVVNEAISDSSGSVLRTESPWYQAIGDDYLKFAFQYAHEADPDAILYYNDYNIEEPGKRARTITMLKQLIADNVPIHGVGIQGHWGLEYPPYSDIRSAIEEYGSLGLKVQITELDISMYAHNDNSSYSEPPVALLEKQADRYQKLFEIFRDNKDVITRVSTWGIADDGTWLDDFPVKNRKNWPLLFDLQHQPKESFWRVVQEPVLSKLIVQSGKLMIPFENGRLSYLVKADEGASEIVLQPVALDRNVTIVVDGKPLEGTDVAVKLQGDHTTVEITTEGYEKSHTYEVHIVRDLQPISWEFEEGSGIESIDGSIFANRATLHGADWVGGKKGGGLSLSGEESFIDFGLGDKNLFADKDFTVSIWVKPDEVNKNQTLLWYGAPIGKDSKLWRLKLTEEGEVYFHLQRPLGKEDMRGAQFITTEPNAIVAKQWSHIAAVRKGDALQIYVNGEIKASKSFGYVVDLSGSNEPLFAGKEKGDRGSAMTQYAGAIDSLRIYDTALDQMEIAAIAEMNGGTSGK